MSDLANALSLDQQIGQLFMVGFQEPEPTSEIITMIRDHHVGGIILFTRNIRDMAQARRLSANLQRIARAAGHPRPLLISIDQENGLVRRLGPDATILPGNMALGATRSEELTEAVARACGEELRVAGVNMNLAPDADVNNNPANPVIGARSFGGDPALVARLTAAAVRGYRSAGIITTIKHFPGHGDTATDSHLALPVVACDLNRLRAVELPPFIAGCAAGADCVMTAHVLLPQIEPERSLPASISPAVIRGLLRDQLGYDGVVMTDCLEMHAISRTVGVPRGAVLALRAGNDLVLISHTFPWQRDAILAVRAAVEKGEIDRETIHQAAERVLHLKERLTWDAASVTTVDFAAHAQLRDDAYARSTTVVTNEEHILPLRLAPEQRLAVIAPEARAVSQAVDVAYDHTDLLAALSQRHPNLISCHLTADGAEDSRKQVLRAAQEAGVVLLVMINARRDPQQAALIADLLACGKPIIGIAAGDPYDLAQFPSLAAGLATYEYTQPALRAAVRVIFGETEARGQLPV